MTDKTTYVTEEGLAKLKQELDYLKTTKRKEIAHRIASAKELGDLSENAEYSDAKEEQGLIENRILELEETLRHIEVIKKPKKSTTVVIGSVIEVSNDTGKKQQFTIVGSKEAAPGDGKISNESPLGRAFLGRKLDEQVTVTVPRGTMIYTISKIA
ncbi:MAG: transcription elongation factor GreA [Candidatus Kerfeldbacteria bacterium]|nr:transcription elongation factor GreA [Candidatus Kerfeldbacteria bacterium]